MYKSELLQMISDIDYTDILGYSSEVVAPIIIDTVKEIIIGINEDILKDPENIK